MYMYITYLYTYRLPGMHAHVHVLHPHTCTYIPICMHSQVTRDACLNQWQFIEDGIEISTQFGSGYPSGNIIIIINY